MKISGNEIKLTKEELLGFLEDAFREIRNMVFDEGGGHPENLLSFYPPEWTDSWLKEHRK